MSAIPTTIRELLMPGMLGDLPGTPMPNLVKCEFYLTPRMERDDEWRGLLRKLDAFTLYATVAGSANGTLAIQTTIVDADVALRLIGDFGELVQRVAQPAAFAIIDGTIRLFKAEEH